eukprot:350095-Chlamydomonas_euryale.AAC.5
MDASTRCHRTPTLPPPPCPAPAAQLVGYRLYEQAQALFRDKVAGKDAAKAVQAKQMDMFKQLMRPRLPPVGDSPFHSVG